MPCILQILDYIFQTFRFLKCLTALNKLHYLSYYLLCFLEIPLISYLSGFCHDFCRFYPIIILNNLFVFFLFLDLLTGIKYNNLELSSEFYLLQTINCFYHASSLTKTNGFLMVLKLSRCWRNF